MKTLFLGITMMGISLAANCQEANNTNGSVSILRSTGFGASLRKFANFIDGEKICKLKNKRCVQYELVPGNYEFAIQMGGKKLKRKTASMALSVAPKGNYYLEVDKKNGFISVKTSLAETTKAIAEDFMADQKKAVCVD